MAINKDISGRIKDLLRDHPEGLNITGIVKTIPINRNTVSRYLDTLLVSGQVEVRHFGMAKIYSLSRRLPVASVLAISSEYVLQLDQYLRIIFINAPFLELLGLPEHALFGEKIDNTRIPLFFSEEYSLLIRWINEGLAGVERRGELTLPAQGRIFTCRVAPAVFTEGQKGVSVLLEDITSRKQDEIQLRDSEGKFRSIVEASTDGILVCDDEGRMIEWNNALSRITGIPREDAVGASLSAIMCHVLVPEDQSHNRIEMATNALKSALRTRQSRFFNIPFEIAIIRPDGERRVIQPTLFPIETNRGIWIGSVIHDITEQRIMVERLRENEERYRTLFHNAADILTVHEIRPDGQPGMFMEVNDVGCRLLGYTREEFLRMSPQEIIDPTMRERMRECAVRLKTEGHAVFEMVHVAKDGRRIPVEIRSHLFEYRG
ncbi:MAG: PAS domain S-box protein, partial [Methanoregula sp.]|nr:PAS domain S-box protein [Methanoregula sp.]